MKTNDAFQPLALEQIPRLALRPHAGAAACGVCPRTFANWMKISSFPVLRIGGVVLIPVDQLREWLADRLAAGEVSSESEVTV